MTSRAARQRNYLHQLKEFLSPKTFFVQNDEKSDGYDERMTFKPKNDGYDDFFKKSNFTRNYVLPCKTQ